jgi:membrane protease YdiL (CAAX protease family)
MTNKYPFWKPFFALFLVGMIGVLSLLLIILPQVEELIAIQPELVELPVSLLMVLTLMQPTIILIITVTIGCLTAPKAGLISFIYERFAYGKVLLPRLKQQYKLAILIGLAFALVVVLLDMAFLPFMGEKFQALQEQDLNLISQLGMGILYGGITEELMLRWGFMGLLVWIGWKVANRSQARPSPGVVWAAIIIAAILFGIGHLPALAAIVPLTTIIVARTVFLNAIGGVAFGWLFWQKSLEAAMIAHAFTHVGFFIIRIITSVF